MKRGICLILAAQLMLLAACGSDAGTGNETTSGSVNSGDTTVTDDGGKKRDLMSSGREISADETSLSWTLMIIHQGQ